MSWAKFQNHSMSNLDFSGGIEKKSYQIRKNLALFCNLVALILGWNCVESVIVTKIVRKIKFEGGWSELEATNYS